MASEGSTGPSVSPADIQWRTCNAIATWTRINAIARHLATLEGRAVFDRGGVARVVKRLVPRLESGSADYSVLPPALPQIPSG